MSPKLSYNQSESNSERIIEQFEQMSCDGPLALAGSAVGMCVCVFPHVCLLSCRFLLGGVIINTPGST